ncbi:hypothetical protein pb186bvf_011449 [Paramecium bursaria]
MINLRKEIQLSVQASFYKAFGIHQSIEIIYKEPHYLVQLPTLKDYHKQWKQSLNPLDIANEVIVHIERPLWQEQKVLQGIEITQFGELRFLIDNQFYENCYQHLREQKQIYEKLKEPCNILQLSNDERSNIITNQLKIILQLQHEQVNLYQKDEAEYYNYIIALPNIKHIQNPKIWMVNQNYEINDHTQVLQSDPLNPLFINNASYTTFHHTKGLLAMIPDIIDQCFLKKSFNPLWELQQNTLIYEKIYQHIQNLTQSKMGSNIKRESPQNSWITIKQNSYNSIANSQINDLFNGKFKLTRQDDAYQIEGNFESFTAENQQQIDQSVPGMLAYDSVNNKLLLFYNQQNIQLNGIVVGQVYEKEDKLFMEYLRDRTELENLNSKVKNLKDITYNRIILAISAFSFIYILNSLAFDPAFEINRVIYRENRENVKQRAEERIFHIKLKNTQNELNIEKDSNFVKIIEQEYATKYLESLGIEATSKNIQMILKQYPLKNCDVTAGWNTSGLYADTITIIVRQKAHDKKDRSISKGNKDDIVKDLELKKLNVQYLQPLPTNSEQQEQKNDPIKDIIDKDDDQEIKFKLNYDIEDIKSKYLFPFNQSYQRRININMQNDQWVDYQQNDDTHHEHDKFLIFESKIFSLPFIHIEIPKELLNDVQKPPQITQAEILRILKQIDKFFPKSIFPKKDSKIKSMKFRYILFSQQDIDLIFQLIQSEEMVRLVGLFIHLSYWLVFGVTQPIQVQSLTKKQIYVAMMEQIDYFETRFKQKSWMHLGMPMILLTLKMATEYLFKNAYVIFFEQPRVEQNTPGSIAMDKIFYLADRMFDQNNLYCRFTFLESDFKLQDKNSGVVLQQNKIVKKGQDAKYMHKRIFAVSPFLDLMLSNPQNGRTRSIVAKQRDIDMRDNILVMGDREAKTKMPPILPSSGTKDEKQKLEDIQKHKMFGIVLGRMEQDLGKVFGQKNALIKLKQ